MYYLYLTDIIDNNKLYNNVDNYYIKCNPTKIFNDILNFDNYIANCKHLNLKLIHLNIRSIKKNFSEFCAFLQYFSFNFDIIVLTETWLRYDIGFDIPNYNKFIKPCKYNKCDGIVVYFRNDIEVSASDIEILNSNCIHFKFNFNNTIIELTAIYRSPNLNKAEFINDVESFLINKKNVNNHIIVGDINIQILDDSMDDLGHRYMNIMYEFGFYQLLKFITRPQSKNSLHLIV